jgi:hypothetical protein
MTSAWGRDDQMIIRIVRAELNTKIQFFSNGLVPPVTDRFCSISVTNNYTNSME